MQPFTLEQKQHIEDQVLNGLISVAYAVKHGDPERARAAIERIERTVKDLPVYFCGHQFYVAHIRTIYGEEITGMVCIKKRRLCPYTKDTVSLCDKEARPECVDTCNLK